MAETIERIGMCRGKFMSFLFHRVRFGNGDRRYRVWLKPGTEKHQNLRPSVFFGRYKVVKSYSPKA